MKYRFRFSLRTLLATVMVAAIAVWCLKHSTIHLFWNGPPGYAAWVLVEWNGEPVIDWWASSDERWARWDQYRTSK